jgi:hypothetical protein
MTGKRISTTRLVEDNVGQGQFMIWWTPSTVESNATFKGHLYI